LQDLFQFCFISLIPRLILFQNIEVGFFGRHVLNLSCPFLGPNSKSLQIRFSTPNRNISSWESFPPSILSFFSFFSFFARFIFALMPALLRMSRPAWRFYTCPYEWYLLAFLRHFDVGRWSDLSIPLAKFLWNFLFSCCFCVLNKLLVRFWSIGWNNECYVTGAGIAQLV
jgi:hypothetical protein